MVRPATSELAIEALMRVWPEYYKGISAVQLATRIEIAAIRRVCQVEDVFAEFINQIGLS